MHKKQKQRDGNSLKIFLTMAGYPDLIFIYDVDGKQWATIENYEKLKLNLSTILMFNRSF